MASTEPDAAPLPVKVELTVAPRRMSEEDTYLLGATLRLAGCLMFYGVLISTCVWFVSYVPLRDQLHRMEAVGELNCTLVGIAEGSGKCCDTQDRCGTYAHTFYPEWSISYGAGVVVTSQKVDEICPQLGIYFNTSAVVQGLMAEWPPRRSCYYDPHTNEMSLDLNNMKASLSTTGARYISTMFFVGMACVGALIAVLVLCVYSYIRMIA